MNERQAYGPPRQAAMQPRQSEQLKSYLSLLDKGTRFHDEAVLKLVPALAQEFAQRAKGDNSLTQVRKFFNQLRLLEGAGEDAEKVRLRLHTLRAQVAYAGARALIDDDFRQYLDRSLTAVLQRSSGGNVTEQIDSFVQSFEILYAYYYAGVKQQGGRR